MERAWCGDAVRDEQQIAALREEIRRAGHTVRWVRLLAGWMVFTPLLGLLLLWAWIAISDPFSIGVPEGPMAAIGSRVLYVAAYGVIAIGGFILAALLIAVPLAASCR